MLYYSQWFYFQTPSICNRAKNQSYFIAFTFTLAVLREQANPQRDQMYVVLTQISQYKNILKNPLLALCPKSLRNREPLFCVLGSSVMFLSWKPAVEDITQQLNLPGFAWADQLPFIWQLFFIYSFMNSDKKSVKLNDLPKHMKN